MYTFFRDLMLRHTYITSKNVQKSLETNGVNPKMNYDWAPAFWWRTKNIIEYYILVEKVCTLFLEI